MKINIHKHIHFFIIALSVLLLVLLAHTMPRALASGTVIQLYVTPASGSYSPGQSFSVAIRLAKNDDTLVDYARADLNFPTDKLSVSSVSTAGSPFTVNAGPQYTFNTYNNSAGTIDVGGQSEPLKAGDFLVATIAFVAKGSGNAAVTFNGQTKVASARNGTPNIATSILGGNYSVTTPTPISPPSSPPSNPGTPSGPVRPPSSPGGTTGTSGSSTNPPGPTTPTNPTNPTSGTIIQPNTGNSQTTSQSLALPTISKVSVTNVTTHSAVVNWQTSKPSTGVIRYGLSPASLTHSVKSNRSETTHSTTLANLAAGTKMYYEIIAINGTSQALHNGSFATQTTPNALLWIALGGGLLVLLIVLAGLFFILKRRSQTSSPKPPAYNEKLLDSTPALETPPLDNAPFRAPMASEPATLPIETTEPLAPAAVIPPEPTPPAPTDSDTIEAPLETPAPLPEPFQAPLPQAELPPEPATLTPPLPLPLESLGTSTPEPSQVLPPAPPLPEAPIPDQERDELIYQEEVRRHHYE